jgi:hypothetical protein
VIIVNSLYDELIMQNIIVMHNHSVIPNCRGNNFHTIQ